ncbi:MAG: hypothetical protein AUH27_02370 [Chloroflexi bacterium 13_1_40CM_66_19]|nr:MAG: hypothetical protein AUH27_02370 [Chloroflexi bacterium 13_1_40CM_66_19]
MPEVKETTDRFVAAMNAHDEKALDALHADDIKFNAPGGFKATNGKDATKFAMTWLKAFPDNKMKVRAPLESPTGTIAPTYKKVVGYGVQLLRVENGKIAEARIYFDQLDQLQQLGLIPATTTV